MCFYFVAKIGLKGTASNAEQRAALRRIDRGSQANFAVGFVRVGSGLG
jgi:hypothetical protein